MGITVLPEEVVARIAAGEAVERPASAVKELIENAIDAGASSIHVESAAGGRQLIRVSDNGAGIPALEIELAFKRHATSKLRAAEDLQDLSTLGFRGEALASIAAVSQTTIITRHRGDPMGMSLRMNGGQIRHQRPVGAPAGTVVTVENLFFNTPARLKFLKADRTEKRNIQGVVTRYAMAYPHIAFTLKQDEREQFRSSGRGDLADVVAAVFGRAHFKRMIAVESAGPARIGQTTIALRGYTSLPDLTRRDRSRIVLYVNGRAIQENALSHAVTGAYEGMIKSGTFPFAVLLLSLPTDFVDVNVHPTKAQVRFREPGQVFSTVQRAVRQALLEADLDEADADRWRTFGFTNETVDYPPPAPPFAGTATEDAFHDADLPHIPETADAPAKPRTLPILRVVGQIGAIYIVAEGPAGLYLIDQNAAHEHVLYQQMREEQRASSLLAEPVIDSQTVLLSPEHDAVLGAWADVLSQLGFEIETFGPHTYVFRALPKVIASSRLADLFPAMLEYLSRKGTRKDNGTEEAIAALAAVAAVKSGQILSMEEMQTLVAQLERCPSPFTSPSGNTTLIRLTREQLALEFRRA
ncbi:MAG: DNA mismatch repair endonuclease MutL [Chloroflexi bacterium]|nr:DNA mismatch repair endonuclease MutL [Chloroflexota bacterium]